ncbi:MAG: hypothetical protein LBT16_01835 [Treponema sp.]|jgi:YegS/Rv2252/BmrU family lipid kinase|nr:hypothetical protein [Treponema sp.]
MNDKKHLFIINPVSLKRQADFDVFMLNTENCLRALGIQDYFMHVSRFPRDAIAVIRRYAKDAGTGAAIRVYAVGGDGILFDCLNGVVGLANIELAPVPYGNSNDFVRAFGEGKNDLFRNITLMALAPSIATDVIFYGNNYALNTCTIGIEAYAVHKAAELNTRYKSNWNRLPFPVRKFMYDFMFFWGGVISAFSPRIINQKYKITIDGKDFSGSYATINIANGACYGGDKKAAIAAVPDDGLLDVLLFKSTNTLNVVKIGTQYLYGKYYKFPSYISYRKAAEIAVRSDEPLVLQLDGEIFIDTNITVKVVPSAVRIVAPDNLSYTMRDAL